VASLQQLISSEGNRVDGREFVWAHFKLNAEQRLRGFNFFVVLAIFADGGVLAACWRRCSAVSRPGC
jgi:hypothetical protein|tara:strand:- start:561 stop:761 length:201 start_codon:yes stop_codon:yes gene_type:complete